MAKTKDSGFSYFLSKKVGKAIMDYKMLEDGDTVLVAVSGGKDSLTLLKILDERRKFVPIKYDLIAVYVDMGYNKKDVKFMRNFFKKNNYKYHIEKSLDVKNTPKEKINCFWCSWNRRKELFLAANKLGCTKLAMGHHKDDIVETFMLNLIFQGEISTMSPKQELFKGKITIIRPLSYVEKKETALFAKINKFKCLSCSCSMSGKTKRAKIAKIIKQCEEMTPGFKTNICRSLSRIKEEYLL